MQVWAVVVAGGSGTRFGRPKQYEPLGARRVVDMALDACREVAEGVVLVVPPARAGDAEGGATAVVAGGATRSGSVRAGLGVVPAGCEVVVVHDAARPLASPDLFRRVVAAVAAGAEGAVPGVPVVDTVKRIDAGGVVVETLDRSGLVAVQTPQAFRTSILRRAHEGDPEASDDAGLVEAHGGRVVVVPGEPANAKLTTADDLATAERLLAAERATL